MNPPEAPTLESVGDLGNLDAAFRRACRGKRHRAEVARFELDLEPQLIALREELLEQRWRPGGFRVFEVRDPVRRRISAAPFRDRVVHQALCAKLEPLLDAEFAPQSFACRKGKGTHRALKWASHWTRRHPFVLHVDMLRFFPSIDHAILKGLLAERIADPRVLGLCAAIVDGSNPQEPVTVWFPGDDLFTPFERRRGLPIGNLTSQLFGNLMLHPIDAWLNAAGIESWLRYSDDLIVFGDSRGALQDLARALKERLGLLRLRPHPRKTQIHPTFAGFPFLGFVLFPDHRKLVGSRLRQARRRLRRCAERYRRGEIGLQEVSRSVRGWLSHARHGDTYRVRSKILWDLVFSRGAGQGR